MGGEASDGIDRQSRQPDELITAWHAADGLIASRDHGAEWTWLVDPGVAPEPSALEHLLGALERLGPLPDPALLASKVVRPDGSYDPASLPVPEIRDHDLAVAAFAQRLLAVRVAKPGSLLVRNSALRRGELPGALGPEWTARLLKHEHGLLVPDSVAVRRAPTERSEIGGLLGLLFSDALERAEKPWFAVRLAEEAVGGSRRAARALSRTRS